MNKEIGKRQKAEGMSKAAFTLLEMIVAVTIFTIFVSMLVGTYLYIARAQRDLAEDRKFYSGARDVIEEISKEIKLNKIYYPCYEDLVSGVSECGVFDLALGLPTDVLALVNRAEDSLIVYSFSDEGVFVREYSIDINTGDFTPSYGYEDGALRISAEGVNFTNLNFRIFPYSDPDANYDSADYQFMPYVTIYLTVAGGLGGDYSLETSVSTRIYE